jgi:hypothetical protein
VLGNILFLSHADEAWELLSVTLVAVRIFADTRLATVFSLAEINVNWTLIETPKEMAARRGMPP